MYIVLDLYPDDVMVDSPQWESIYLAGIFTGEKRSRVWHCTTDQWLTGIFEESWSLETAAAEDHA